MRRRRAETRTVRYLARFLCVSSRHSRLYHDRGDLGLRGVDAAL